MSTPSQTNQPDPHDDSTLAPHADHQLSDRPEDLHQDAPIDDQDSSDSRYDGEQAERAERRKRHVRLFCFSCNRYEGHSIASRSRTLYSFLVGFTFGLYYYLGRYACHCCGTVRLARKDMLNPRFWYRSIWLGGIAKSKKKSKSKSRRKG